MTQTKDFDPDFEAKEMEKMMRHALKERNELEDEKKKQLEL